MKGKVERLDQGEYRKFALLTGGIVVVLFGLLIPWLFDLRFPRWPWILGGVLALWGLLAPATLHPVYAGWMKFGHVMNWINTRLILGILFFGIFLPFGVVMRLIGKDPMHRKLDKAADSYWSESRRDPKDNVERPY
jgi:hypothetical protein